MTEIRIFLADDDELIRNGLAELLNDQEDLNIVATAANGRQALEKASMVHFDVALIDVDMPHVDGLEVAQSLLESSPTASVIMLTAFEYPDSLAKSLALGVHGFLTKDIPVPQLAEHIRQAHSGQTVLGPKPIEMITENYASQHRSQEQFRSFNGKVATLPKHLRGTFNELLEAKTNKEIAETLHLSPATVRSYVSDILAHTGSSSRGQLAITAIKAQTPFLET